MLKPSTIQHWCYDDVNAALLMVVDDGPEIQVKLQPKFLVDCARQNNEFNIDDATMLTTFSQQTELLDLSSELQQDLVINCVAARRFFKPVQPKSWFFTPQTNTPIQPQEGEIFEIRNDLNQGLVIVVEAGECASLCVQVNVEPFYLSERKQLEFGQAIKIMHDRLSEPTTLNLYQSYDKVG